MPEKSSKNIDSTFKQTAFQTTPIMSSYLLAFVCGEIHCLESETKHGVKVRTWATVAQPKENLRHALTEAVAIQEYFEDYFQTPFPLTKCDHIALPDFDAGAMENWGLITYREVALLTDATNKSIPSEQYVSLVVAHELSHQWFGNLVTMKWWDDLWLNESFASIMEHIPLEALHPDWYQWEKYAEYDIISASNRDVFSDVQNVGIGVNHPDEIRSLFDGAIVYSKGGRLIKMMREYVGDDVLRKALKQYFKDHAYKNATRNDLWKAISQASGKDIGAIMTPWIEQSGMPLLKVEPGSAPNKRKIQQSRFIFDKNNDTQLWPVPLLPLHALSPELIQSEQTEITINNPKDTFLLNKNGSGHYVVHYEDKGDHKNLIGVMSTQSIGSEARLNILNDHLLLARRGDISLIEVLEIATEMKNETRDAVWGMILRTLAYAGAIGEDNKTIEKGLERLRYKLSKDNYQKLGWVDNPSDDPNTASLRSTMIGTLLASKDKEMIDFVLDFYNSKPIEDIPSDRRSIVFSTVVKHGKKPEDISKLVELYKTSQDPDMLLTVAAGLCATENPEVAKQLLTEGMKEQGYVKPQDYFRFFAYLSRNKYTRDTAWDWMVEEWDRLLEIFSGGINIDSFPAYSASPIYSKDKQQRYIDFYEPKISIPRISRGVKVALAEIEARVQWRERDLQKIEAFFKSVQ